MGCQNRPFSDSNYKVIQFFLDHPANLLKKVTSLPPSTLTNYETPHKEAVGKRKRNAKKIEMSDESEEELSSTDEEVDPELLDCIAVEMKSS